MTIHNFENENSILNRFLKQLRDTTIQKDSMRFRKNIERVGEIISYEISKTLPYKDEEITTPLGTKNVPVLADEIVVCSILRAGLPLHQGLLNYFDDAENGYISAFRKHENGEDEFEVIVDYFAAPSLEGKILVLADPMLATGRTLENVLEGLKPHGTPKQIHIASVIGSQEGVDFVATKFPENTHLWIAAVDDELNSKGYIIPGLGDAGDLAYGSKL
ncbi:uracil phosphoribosyltransferase [Cellulophaga baltica]|uniref:uracil phosphoribosyltransferase n=1 Tax=Cellulophaga TaxID=104264 RepID=UPI001C065C47|nr:MULTISPECIES: uracil phosphoribosyltransferase [Cellulophaga]MBU2996458.1 uracil phosphoribosyltransferase [Cellulophaga baltica]MDO6767852.1 uracil phosphoribosyltransferase [Cellulophaga sp. 1_MG-2023]